MRSRAYISAIIFLLLTAAKLFFPASAECIRKLVSSDISPEEFRSEVIALGRQLSGGDAAYASESDGSSAPVDVKSEALDISADFDLEDMVDKNLGVSDSAGASGDDGSNDDGGSSYDGGEEQTTVSPSAGENAESPAPSEESGETYENDEKYEKYEAFLEVQSAFSGYSLPTGVSYDIPEIPFDCAVPASAAVSSAFGYRVHPVYGDVRFHYGCDFALYDGEPVCAFADGTVISVQELSGYGLTLIIEHSEGYTSLYAHLGSVLVDVGDSVTLGQKVALSGHSGVVTGPHLHFEVEKDGIRYNPELCF